MMKMQFEPPNIAGMGDDILAQYRAAATPIMRDIGKNLVAKLKAVVGRMGKGPAVSRPGEAPLRETGAYMRGFRRALSSKKHRVQLDIGNILWQQRGRFLEDGTETLEPRPHIAPTLERESESIFRRLSGM